MENFIYSKEYTVHVYEAGINEKLNPHSLFNYLQDTASEHAVSLGFGREHLIRMNSFWILSRIAVEVKRWPSWKEKVIVTTWPRGSERLFAIRDFKVETAKGEVIAAATSSWLIVDITTRRIRRPDKYLPKYSSELTGRNAIGRYAVKLDPPVFYGSSSLPFNVKCSDLDVNRHTNNAAYIRWITDSYDIEFIDSYPPVKFEVNYLAESHQGEEIIIRRADISDRIFFHSVFRNSDVTELCRIRVEHEYCRR